MTCSVEKRNALRALVHAIEMHDRVVATHLLTPDASPTDRWELEVTIEGDAVPPRLATQIGRHNLWLADVSQRGDPVHTTATLRP